MRSDDLGLQAALDAMPEEEEKDGGCDICKEDAPLAQLEGMMLCDGCANHLLVVLMFKARVLRMREGK